MTNEAAKATVQNLVPTLNLSDLRKVLPINRVEFRIQTISKAGNARILAYKDARVDMDRLDEVLGVGNWQRKHETIDGNLYCSVGIWNRELNQWVWVQDVGTESQTEAEKGQASDSFKRACFNLGIGRELYSYPVIQLKLKDNEFEPDPKKPEKMRQTWNLKLRQWSWDIRWGTDESGRPEVTSLLGYDEKGVIRFNFSLGHQTNKAPKKEVLEPPANSDDPQESLNEQAPHGGTTQSAKQQAREYEQATGGPWPWYNDFDKHRDTFYDKIADGELTVEDILDDLKSRHRISKAVETKIRNLGK